ncbi:MAG TPA: ABC transporter substrate-binding protein [Longimicrobiaceae bacterium]|nr:ABC transporter substrate-binding protein [Longimicrobiaceae bacterium]
MRELFALPVLALALAVSACGGDGGREGGDGDDPQVPEAERYGGTAVAALGQDVADINPLTSSDYNSNQLSMFVLYTPVIRYDESFEPQPRLAKSWELSPDSTELTFRLRDDVFWHDGVRTTAHDLKFAYDLARNPETAYPNASFWTHYGDASVPDSFTFRVKLEPHAEYLDPWRTFFAMPRHVLEGVAPSELKNHPFSTRQPLGNGPFRFVSRQAGQSWTFEANPDYPRELGGRPYLDRLVVRVIPDATARLTELLTGRLDYYVQVTPEQTPRIEASDRARLVTFPHRSYVFIGWNQKRPMFQDARVRRALTMAINKKGMIDGVLYGHGEVAHSSVPSIFWQHDPTAGAGLQYDPEAAKRLLAEAGWRDRNGDGIVENERGEPFRFTLKTNQGNQERKDLTEVVQSDLRKVGVDAQPQLMEFGTLIEQLNTTRDFDAVVLAWVTEFRPDDADLFHCDRRDRPYQWVGHCNRATDRLLDTIPRIVDRAEAKPVWSRYQQAIARDQPYTFLYFQERLVGVSERLRNVDPDARGDFVGVSRWWILPGARRGS